MADNVSDEMAVVKIEDIAFADEAVGVAVSLPFSLVRTAPVGNEASKRKPRLKGASSSRPHDLNQKSCG